jgi:cytochrome c oxidase subunit 1
MFFTLHVLGLSSLLSSINFIVTIFNASSLSLNYTSFGISLFCLSILITSILLVIALPILAGCVTMIIFDRHFNTTFFDPIRGGDILYFQHLF